MVTLNSSERIQAIAIYQEQIAANPSVKSNYWYLGLYLLLEGKEAEAQITWMNAILEASVDEAESDTKELLDILEKEAKDQENQLKEEYLRNAWLIRQHMREISPENIVNLFSIVRLAIALQIFTSEDLASLGLIELLEFSIDEASSSYSITNEVTETVLLKTWELIFDYTLPDELIFDFIKACLPYIHNLQAGIDILIPAALRFGFSYKRLDLSIRIAEISLDLYPHNSQLLGFLSLFNQDIGNYATAIELAQEAFKLAHSLTEKIFANYVLLRGYAIAGGYWQEALNTFHDYESLLQEITATPSIVLTREAVLNLFSSLFFFPYFRDEPQLNRNIQNSISAICQRNIREYAVDLFSHCQSQLEARRKKPTSNHRKLKIGYLCSYFRQHSVGWLARSLFQHHDREKFEIYAYFAQYQVVPDPIQTWYEQQTDHVYRAGVDGSANNLEIAQRISNDEIDILVDLDSITSNSTCELLALKPAPIQVTWLGWDAVGLPAIDYFLADSYVLPPHAQDYYQEKIWQLPHSYVAVDGFEVGVPTLQRIHLDIPEQAIIFLTNQGGYKRHPETIHWQMQIVKNVPNSYLLIKGFADPISIQHTFEQIAKQEGVSSDRLRFLSTVATEAEHRANLRIADVVLDTYPYNGATTTLETLWMGIPLVTRVGEQFAARNSYTMMINAGVTEGIAWTDAEYIDWGIRLGTDEQLRKDIACQLRRSRQVAPLWNGQAFVRNVEEAYTQMWHLI